MVADLRKMIDESRQVVAQTANAALVWLYWNIGKWICEEILKETRADYGERIVQLLSGQLSLSHFIELLAVKNTADAWPQMMFDVSFLRAEQVQWSVSWARNPLTRQRSDFQNRFAPALAERALVRAGLPIEASGDARGFLGRSKERHWLLE